MNGINVVITYSEPDAGQRDPNPQVVQDSGGRIRVWDSKTNPLRLGRPQHRLGRRDCRWDHTARRGRRMMSRDDYARWWIDNWSADGELLTTLPEPVVTLAAHVVALQERIDKLPSPDSAPLGSWHAQCCCAYQDPRSVCAPHETHR